MVKLQQLCTISHVTMSDFQEVGFVIYFPLGFFRVQESFSMSNHFFSFDKLLVTYFLDLHASKPSLSLCSFLHHSSLPHMYASIVKQASGGVVASFCACTEVTVH